MVTAEDVVEGVKRGDVARVRELVDADPTMVNARAVSGETPVLAALYRGAGEALALLLARGAELDLFEAAGVGDAWRIGELLDGGADVNSFSHDGWTPLHLACYFDGRAAVELLLARGADARASSRNEMANTPLHAAVAGRHEEVVEVLLAHGADVNATAAGWTPLHVAAAGGSRAIAEGLLGAGARADAPGPDGRTPLDLALESGHLDVADLLRARAGRRPGSAA